MSKIDAQRALTIYKTFAKQTSLVVEFLGIARQYENATRLEIPKLKHAPTSLTSSLEEYLNDPDFEVNRRQYLAHQAAKKGNKPSANVKPDSLDGFRKPAVNSGSKANAFSEPKTAQSTAPLLAPPKSPAPDLIDFFDSIEQNQQPMAVQSQSQAQNFQNAQQTGFAQQQSFYPQIGQQSQSQPQQNGGGIFDHNPFGQPQSQQPLHQDFTGLGFRGYASQPFSQQQDAFSDHSQTTGSSFPTQQQPFSTGQTSFASTTQQSFNTGQSQPPLTNPFRQSMFPQATSASVPSFQSPPPIPSSQSPPSTNPFARSSTMPLSTPDTTSPFTSHAPPQTQGTPFSSAPPQQPQQPPLAQHMTPQRTGTNPFARTPLQMPQSQSSAQPLVASSTGTNPFRQSAFVNQQTGQGWQGGQGTMGGLEQLPTMPVFPRQGQQQQPQQQQNPWS